MALGLLIGPGTFALRLLLVDDALREVALARAAGSGAPLLLVERDAGLRGGIAVALEPAAAGEHPPPRWWFAGGRRWFALVAERRDLPGEPSAEEHVRVVASTPILALLRDTLVVTAIYALAAGLLVLAVRRRLLRAVDRALAPLREAAAEASALAALPPGELAGRRLAGAGDDEVGRFVEAVNRLLDRLAAALDASRRFTGHAAHELRTPLTELRGLLDVALRRGRSAEEMREVLDEVRQGVAGLGRVVESLLILARLDAGALERRTDRHRLVELVEDALRAEGMPPALAAGIPDALEVLGDGGLLTTAIANLLRNGELHGGGVTAVRGGREADRVRLVVEDEGPGPDLAADLFERFTRGRSRGDAPGVGLGLSLVSEIASLHGGHATLELRVGGGARAILDLPAAPSRE